MMKTAFYDGITEFIFVENQPQKADVIFLPGGAYPEAALYAAKLYQECYAPLVLPSGKYSIMKGRFELSPQEAERRRMPQRAAGQSGNICRGFYSTAVCRAGRSCGRTGRRTRMKMRFVPGRHWMRRGSQ